MAVRDYHAKYYVPQNLCLIVSGKISGGIISVLSVLQHKIERILVGNGYNRGPHPPGCIRPFLETQSAVREPFKNKGASIALPNGAGEVSMAFMGPCPGDILDKQVHASISPASYYSAAISFSGTSYLVCLPPLFSERAS